LPAVAREARGWRARARAIPAPQIRADALSSLATKRGHTDGAALFTSIPRSRDLHLLRLLVAYELTWDFLDSVNERGARAGQLNGRQLHLALIDALQPDSPNADYYRHHRWKDDGGYLNMLVKGCRSCCRRLPAFERVRPAVLQEAIRAQVLGINHELDPLRRDVDLRRWAEREFPNEHRATWFELTGAASASLTIHALLALASGPLDSGLPVERVTDAYFPWISAATTMLDSFVDQGEDASNGDHSYVAHYQAPAYAARRIVQLVARSVRYARALPDGERHVLIVACMIAMYLSKDSARTPAMRKASLEFARAGGSLSRLLLPVLRLWRIVYSQRSV